MLMKTLKVFTVIIILVSFFSCWGKDWQIPWSTWKECNVPKFYDDKQGIHEGKAFLLKADSTLDTVSVFIEVKMGGYADKTIEFQEFPIKCLLWHLDKCLLDNISPEILEKKINLHYKYFLWGEIHEWDGDSIGPNYTGYLYTKINSDSGSCSDIIYSEDKSQKLKYNICAYTSIFDYDLIKLELERLEFNDSIITQPWYQSTVKIDIGDKIDDVNG